MKKSVFLCLLILVLCFALCACGGNDAGSGNAGGESGGDEDSGTQVPVICEGSITPDANWELMQYFYGDWKRVEASPICDIKTVSIRKDGTCMVNGQEYQLTFTLGEVLSTGNPNSHIVELRRRTPEDLVIWNHGASFSMSRGQVSNYLTEFAVSRAVGGLYILK